MTLSTPGGRCSAQISASSSRLRGAASASSTTTVLPTARAAGILKPAIISGEFHGRMAPDNPQRFETGELQLVLTRRQDHAFGFSRDPGEVPKEVRQGGGLGGRACVNRVAGVQGGQGRQVVKTCFDGRRCDRAPSGAL